MTLDLLAVLEAELLVEILLYDRAEGVDVQVQAGEVLDLEALSGLLQPVTGPVTHCQVLLRRLSSRASLGLTHRQARGLDLESAFCEGERLLFNLGIERELFCGLEVRGLRVCALEALVRSVHGFDDASKVGSEF